MKQCMDSENLHRRLRKILGQVQAIDRMIEDYNDSALFVLALVHVLCYY